MTDKPILDVACGGRMFYFDKNDPRVLFCDKREVHTTLCDGRTFEIKPDMVSDFTNLPFDNNSFKLVVFDPPHLLHNEISPITGYQQIKYGALQGDWKIDLKKGFAECFRVLEPYGILIFKWNETCITVSEILKLTPEKPVFGHKSGKRSNTHWICFMKGENALDYTNRLKAENEKLKVVDNRVAFCNAYDHLQADYKRVVKEKVQIRKQTAKEIYDYIYQSGVINVASDTIKMYFKERYGVEVEE